MTEIINVLVHKGVREVDGDSGTFLAVCEVLHELIDALPHMTPSPLAVMCYR